MQINQKIQENKIGLGIVVVLYETTIIIIICMLFILQDQIIGTNLSPKQATIAAKSS